MPIPKNFQSPVRMSAKEKAFQQIQRWIIDGTLEPGEKLYDAELSDALGISRTPVREALQLLQSQGFVEMYPGRQTIVTTLTKEDVPKIYPPLASLQALAAEEATPNVTAAHIRKLRELNESYRAAIADAQLFAAMEKDEQFHDVILEIADNPYITQFSSLLQLHVMRMKYLFFQQPIRIKAESVQEHERLIQAMERGEAQEAAAIMKENWLRPMREVYQILVQSDRKTFADTKPKTEGDPA
ncbi:GntR family transcriptional regulator [Brevibacillus composti]|uniref:GntR family transcriptional regulator n=1 Tax=Brevibacillus composti TaxID=2796470 RepID=A0A7T5EPE6_9BACL|nr:GntR family transcriptional regulator [Brevibacillus composti]QQE76295.1 GntR family transcriptional regulator [Brevibacillus composti]QUO43322.1 GntR family transcriptional regulator [Brevibacillus composti]